MITKRKNKVHYFTRLMILVLVVSFLVGGISGGAVGFITGGLASKTDFSHFKESLIKQLGFISGTVSQEGEKTGLEETKPEGTGPEEKIIVSQEAAVTAMVKRVSPSVVSIVVTKDLSKYYKGVSPLSPFDDFFDFPFKFEFPAPSQGEQQVGGGTGFIISSDGLILTNKHVVSDSQAKYTVVTNDGKSYPAQVKAADPFFDVAIVKIEATGLPVIELGDSDKIQIGQTVIAIGNALGEFRNTVTKGVISGIGRSIVASGGLGQTEVLEDVIQTDAAINPGNSGGPLLNLAGQVIGINTAISQEGQLISFAIPINSAKEAIDSVKKYGKIVRPFLGVRYVLVNQSIAQKNNLPVNYGALIVRGSNQEDLAIVPGSPADKAGLVENDIILEINGQKINEEHTLAKEIRKCKVGDTVKLKILHKGEEKTVNAVLGEYK